MCKYGQLLYCRRILWAALLCPFVPLVFPNGEAILCYPVYVGLQFRAGALR